MPPKYTFIHWEMFYCHLCAEGRLNGPEQPPNVMKQRERWNTLQIRPSRHFNSYIESESALTEVFGWGVTPQKKKPANITFLYINGQLVNGICWILF